MKTITSVKVSDVEKRRLPSKHYVYVIFVRWSDGGQYVIYRRYSRFFDLQSTLLDKFPIEAGTIDPTQRILPILPGKILFGRSHVREVAVKRLKPIETYCKALIILPASISRCDDVLNFFEVEDDDLEPPSDKLKKIVKPQAEKISKPKELKRFVAVQEYMKQDRGEIDLRAGQVVELVEQSQSGWWFVNAEDEQGWVPSTFLQSREGEVEDTTITETKNTGEWYVCVDNYQAGSEDELSLHKGDIVKVVETNMHGWWLVRCQGVQGLAPATYLTKLQDQQSMGLAEKGHVSGVEIITSLFQISELLKQETGQSSEIGVGAERQTSGMGPADLYSIVNKTKSLERGGSLRPPPRQNSIEKAAVKLYTEKPASRYLTRAEFCDTVGDGISFKANQEVNVLERAAGGWWFVQIGEQNGWAPASYMCPTQVEETIKHQQKRENKTSLQTILTNTLPSKQLDGGSSSVPLPQENKPVVLKQTPKQFSFNNVNDSCNTESVCELKCKANNAAVVAHVHPSPPDLESEVMGTMPPSVTAQTPRFQAKPKPPLKPSMPKPVAKSNPPNLPTKSSPKESSNPYMQGITASLKAKFENSESSRNLPITCPRSKYSSSTSSTADSLAGQFNKSKKLATKPDLPVKPIGNSNK